MTESNQIQAFLKKKKNKKRFKKTLFFTLIFLILAIVFSLLIKCPPDGKSCLATVIGDTASDDSMKEEIKPVVKLVKVSDFRENNFAIDTTGLVESSNQIDLKSQVSSRVASINVNLGEEVRAGQVLVSFENTDIAAQLLQARAGLEAEQARLLEIKRGARIEEVQLAESRFNNAKAAYEEAQKNLENTENKADIDIKNAYTGALNALNSAADLGKSSLLAITDIQYAHFQGNDPDSLSIANAKGRAVYALLGQSNAGNWAISTLSKLSGGAFGLVKEINSAEEFSKIDNALSEMNQALARIRETLNVIPIVAQLTDAEKASLALEKTIINGQISAISSVQQAILMQGTANISLINAAQMGLTSAKSAFESAKNQLDLINAGATSGQIAIQEARVKSAQATVNQIQAIFAKTIISTPISGTIAVLPVRLGELVNPGQLVVSIVNTDGLEVEAYVGGDNLLNISPGNSAIIEGSINGVITHVAPSIDPFTKKVEVKIVVTDENPVLVIGQFVNVRISINEDAIPEDVYLIPLQSIRITPDESFVYAVSEEKKIEEVSIELGKVIGEMVEVVGGIDSGMEIVYSVRGLEVDQEVIIE